MPPTSPLHARIFLSIALLCALATGCAPSARHDTSVVHPSAEQKIVTAAEDALQRLAGQDNIPPFTATLQQACGVVIFPSLYKGSYFFGVEGGNGVVLARTADGAWSAPAFVTMSDVSFGFQAGGQITTAMLILMDQQYLEDALADGLTLNADISAAIGPVGHSAQLDAATHKKGIVYVAYTRGLAFSMALEGGAVRSNTEHNRNYYGIGVTPDEIISGVVDNDGSLSLRQTLADMAAQPSLMPVTE